VHLTKFKLDGKGVAFDLPGIPGNPTFRGTVTHDGQKIAGDG
jgi:hypothetical protein